MADYIAKRGASLSEERTELFHNVKDTLIGVVGDKPVNTYTPDDATSYENVLLKLPPNWNNGSPKNPLTGLSIVEAANKAAELGLSRQSSTTIKKKWTILFGIFKHAAVKHKPLDNPFTSEALLIDDDSGNANQQKTPFTATELNTLLSSDLSQLWGGRLY